MAPKRVIERYKSLADSERGFKDVESELKIDPVHHRLPERVRAHASICFMALILRKGDAFARNGELGVNALVNPQAFEVLTYKR